MSALHQIERSNGTQLVPFADTALGNVRTALSALQTQPQNTSGDRASDGGGRGIARARARDQQARVAARARDSERSDSSRASRGVRADRAASGRARRADVRHAAAARLSSADAASVRRWISRAESTTRSARSRSVRRAATAATLADGRDHRCARRRESVSARHADIGSPAGAARNRQRRSHRGRSRRAQPDEFLHRPLRKRHHRSRQAGIDVHDSGKSARPFACAFRCPAVTNSKRTRSSSGRASKAATHRPDSAPSSRTSRPRLASSFIATCGNREPLFHDDL